MKPERFEYFAATSVDSALAFLVDHNDAKLLAGGQSLIPMMNLRLARPRYLVDIMNIPRLNSIVPSPDGSLTLGSLLTHQQIATDQRVVCCCPVLATAAGAIGHWAIRNRGTLGGSLAHADPAAELPAVMVALDATFDIQGPKRRRQISAREFFLGVYQTELESDELLLGVRVPPVTGQAWGFYEIAKSAGDFALAGAVVALGPQGQGSVTWFGVGTKPVYVAVENWPEDAFRRRAWLQTLTNHLDTDGDQHATERTRQWLALAAAERAYDIATGKRGPYRGN